VKEVLTRRKRILKEEFVKFQSFYCFESEFCGPAKGNEKGKETEKRFDFSLFI